MRIRIILIAALFWISGFGQEVQEQHCLWQVSGDKNIAYLMGSIHLLKKEHYPLDPVFDRALGDVQHVVFELHPDSLLDIKAQFAMLQSGLCDSGTTLAALVSPRTYEIVKQKVEKMGLSMTGLEQFKPWYLATLLTAFEMNALGFDPQYGIELNFIEKSRAATKILHGLETIRFQVGLFSGMADSLQDSLLVQTVQDMEELDRDVEKLTSAWQRGDGPTLEEELLDNFLDYPQLYDRMIVSRNMNWLQQIDAFLKQEVNYLVIVGTGHLIGKDGLVELLRARGYSIKQL